MKAYPYHRTRDLDDEIIDVLDVEDITCTYCFRWSGGLIYNDVFSESDLRSPIPIDVKYKKLERKATKYASKKRSTAERPVTTTELQRQHTKRQRILNAQHNLGGRLESNWMNPLPQNDNRVQIFYIELHNFKHYLRH